MSLSGGTLKPFSRSADAPPTHHVSLKLTHLALDHPVEATEATTSLTGLPAQLNIHLLSHTPHPVPLALQPT